MTDYVYLTSKENEELNDLLYPTVSRFKKDLMERPALEDLSINIALDEGGTIECIYHKIAEPAFLPAGKEAVGHEVLGGCEVTSVITHPKGGVISYCKYYMAYDTHTNQVLGRPLSTDVHPACLAENDTLEDYCTYFSSLTLRTVLLVQAALLHHQGLLTFTTEFKKKESKPGKKSKKKGQKSASVRKVRVYHLVPLEPEVTSIVKKAQAHRISCPAWGVRGHYRHYKSGKVVYIQPHVKGKNKELYQSREYVLVPKKKTEKNEIVHQEVSA